MRSDRQWLHFKSVHKARPRPSASCEPRQGQTAMSLLFRIVYAAHANGTHHKLALDALQRLSSPDAENWRRLFLKHAESYITGSKAPDKEFKDFRNHVLHVEDNFWGGAPEKAEQWYARLVTALKDSSWDEAAYCAGVLSHYYTDPIHPFHTAQSQEESNIHRAVEWSISKSYDSLRKQGETYFPNLAVVLPTGEDWLKAFVIEGAETSNQYYTSLIAHYDFDQGVSNPPAGLTPRCRVMVSELLIYAAEGFARLLDRAFADADVTPPEVTLSAETVVATLKIPVRWVEKKLADSEDRAAVRAMFDELNQTGKVDKTLSEDDAQIRDLHAKEILEPRAKARARARQDRMKTRPEPTHKPATTTKTSGIAPPPAQAAGQPEAKHDATAPAAPPAEPAPAPAATESDDIKLHTLEPRETSPQHTARTYLALHDDLVDAPSIGPKTASRFYNIGISTVADFLAEDAAVMAELLDTRHINALTLQNWQDQARLVMTVPGLRGGHAQLLQGAGYNDAEAIANAEPSALASAVLNFAATSDGKRILRDGDAPDIEKIKSWIDNAAEALAA